MSRDPRLTTPLTENDLSKLLKELKAAKKTTLEIPEGYTHIDDNVMNYRNFGMGYLTSVEEITYPSSMIFIGSSLGLKNVKRINLLMRGVGLGGCAFSGDSFGLLGKEIKDKRVVEKIVIPPGSALSADRSRGYFGCAFTGIHTINELIFEEGYSDMNWGMFFKNTVNYLYIPDSVNKIKGLKDYKKDVVINKISAPAHLKGKIGDGVTKLIVWRE